MLHSVTTPNGDAEGTLNTTLEANATGLPIISTRHAGIPEAVVHGQTGFLVAEHDVTGMATYMVQLATDATLAGQLGVAARAHMVQFYDLHKRIAILRSLLTTARDAPLDSLR
jgi:colanic acid/amylovoran biosynthesis glycosyltransferase